MFTTLKSYKSTLVGKKFLELAEKKNVTLTPMQLLKLVYLAHAWMLALYRRPLIQERVEAWKYGPVIFELYQAIRHFRSQPITNIECIESEVDKDALDIIEQVFNKYGHLSGIRLSMITHESNSPWERTWNNGSRHISNDLITDYYQQLAHNG